ncbi:hypothetical protein [Mesorhizobium sp. M1A.F.Ca.ET.072.01.1.1]|uniref:hypothetical protein n=1 Tax=Mesorhizobium sp. M1A.F.Ca.ET.072.01.1.1 TaxID=2496753 RepID=UPI00167C0C7A|nr:hypothetical protein [Mesorhizobium sp. M1A.F.Ca.ET.072.01.1.1]
MFTNIRILIGDLTRACVELGEVHVIAAGSMYATLKLDDDDIRRLSKAHIHWSID